MAFATASLAQTPTGSAPVGADFLAAPAPRLTERYRGLRTIGRVLPAFDENRETASAKSASPVRRPMRSPTTWGMSLDGVDPAAIKACATDLIIMDYSRDGTQGNSFTAAEVQELRGPPNSKAERKKLIAYMSIGEAGSYRDLYWKPAWAAPSSRPSWLGPLNPEWEGDYRVAYWDQGWQDIIVDKPDSYLDRLMAAGFDGVFLDTLDTWEWQYEHGRKSAADDMVDFDVKIAERAWAKNPNFLIIPNNSDEFISRDRFRSHISALVTESVYFRSVTQPGNWDKSADVELQFENETNRRLTNLAMARQEQLPVLTIEYLLDQPEDRLLVPSAAKMIRAAGFFPHFAKKQAKGLACILNY